MIHANGLQFGQNQEEMIQMDRMGFPYACYYREMERRFDDTVPWHWHKSIEIDYIVEGEMTLMTSDRTILLKKGDLCLINTGALHCFHIDDSVGQCKFYAHLFHSTFLTGMHNSLIEQKYFLPITGNASFMAYVFSDETEKKDSMVSHFMNAVELEQNQSFGYEFGIRDELSKLWCIMFQQTGSLHEHSGYKKFADARRVKDMIQYIHEHYEESISLSDIAGAAYISRQECMRCFRKYIHTSPVSYLTEYRVRMAARQLLYTDLPILAISESCGFSSGSYFTKVFRSVIGCTPKEYRRMHAEQKV